MDIVSLLTKLIADIRARDWLDAIADVGQLIAMVIPYLKTTFASAPHPVMMAAAPCNSIDDFTTHLEAHLEDAKAGAIDWSKLSGLLIQLAPFLLSLFLKKQP